MRVWSARSVIFPAGEAHPEHLAEVDLAYWTAEALNLERQDQFREANQLIENALS